MYLLIKFCRKHEPLLLTVSEDRKEFGKCFKTEIDRIRIANPSWTVLKADGRDVYTFGDEKGQLGDEIWLAVVQVQKDTPLPWTVISYFGQGINKCIFKVVN